MATINGAESSRELKLICRLVRKWESQPLREYGFEKHGEFGGKCYGKLWPFKIVITCDFFTVNFPSFKGVFSSPFHPKFFGFWPIILQNGTKHHAKILVKRYPFSILDFGLKRLKKSQKAFTHPMKNLVFWIELNTPIKILPFCISSLQSSWHFAFYGELKTA
jgi:hypothetical protein